jgi:F0F1-type ATP synthase membrane subunit b/b'
VRDTQFYVQIAVWSQVISALLFMGVLVWLWFKFIQPAILGAQDRQNKQIAQAERHRDEAKSMLDVLRNDVENARRDAELIGARIDGEATRESESIVAETRDAGERSVRDAQVEFSRALAAGRERLRIDLLEKALRRARDDAARRVDAATDAGLVERFTRSLERPHG